MEKLGFVERSIEQIAIVLKALLGGEIIEEQSNNFEMQLNDLLQYFGTEPNEIEKINLDKLSLFLQKMGSNEIELVLLKASKLYLEKNNKDLAYKYFELYKWVEQKQNRFFQFGNDTSENLINDYHKELSTIFYSY